jgi:single-strand DNA-binding protein
MSYEIKGNILHVYAEQTFASGFSKREFVITTDGKYPQCVKLELTKEKCVQLDQFREGDPVKVHFNVRGNEHLGKYYVNLQAWKIEPQGSLATAPEPRAIRRSPEPPVSSSDSNEDVPF